MFINYLLPVIKTFLFLSQKLPKNQFLIHASVKNETRMELMFFLSDNITQNEINGVMYICVSVY